MADHSTQKSQTLRFAEWVVRWKFPILMALIVSTLFFSFPIVNAVLIAFFDSGWKELPAVNVDTRARDQWPDHPFISAQDKFANKFGGSAEVAIAVVVEEGTIFTPEVIGKINRITHRLDGRGFNSHSDERDELRDQLDEQGVPLKKIQSILDSTYPPYPVNHYQIRSVTANNTRVVQVEAAGDIETSVLMKEPPQTQEEADAIAARVRQNPPFIYGRLVSLDEKGALISAGFVTDRLNNRETFMAVFDHVQQIKKDEETDNLKIYISGYPILVGWILLHAFEITFFLVATVVMIFVLLWAYFRRWHGVLIPAVAAVATSIWGLGFTGWVGFTFDPLILVIPTIITARAVSHTVQMAERFFEDYEILLPALGDPEAAKKEAATVAMSELIVPGTLGIVTDVAGLLVILVTSIPQMRELGIFGAFWVSSIIITVEILHPVLICYLPAPSEHEHFLPSFMVRFTRFLGDITTHPVYKYVIAVTTVLLLVGSTYITLVYSQIGEAKPGTPLLFPDHEWNIATAQIADRFGGVDSLVVFLEGDKEKASGDAVPILRMAEFERWMAAYSDLGATISIVPILRMAWAMNHYGDPKWSFVSDDQAVVRQQIYQMRTNGAPGAMDPYLTPEGKDANIRFFYRDHKGKTIRRTVLAAEEFIRRNPIGQVIVRLEKDRAVPDDGFFSRGSLLDKWYYMLGPLLPERHHMLTVQIRNDDGTYTSQQVNAFVGANALPEWIQDFRAAAQEDYQDRLDYLDEGEIFTWPEELAEWSLDDIDYWWQDEEYGIRAVALNTKELIVEDLKAVDGVPAYQQTNSWTRGVQFVMAGGLMGILAAIDDEVERSHVANIVLIFLVIFTLHSITYQSVPSGFIILLQIATATMLSLAYMAIAGMGLNINTLPVQSVGVGIGVDYAIYIVDRIRHEVADTADIDEAVRRAIRTTGMAVSFTASTIVGGIFLWTFSNLRFQADMAKMLCILMVINMLGALTVVPAFYSVFRPKVATALLTEDQVDAIHRQKEMERRKGMRDE
ncbi:MAG: MMPL family transporter [Deltaproteobacteria bacterium]|nr:MMPL family transporter [Deltaproteobacteria bacterium]